ncbi:hypothetical protein ACIBL3_41720 [Kribbella sp. NPDC050124]|uniref:hypothetical protein n=1 Tax=Kribbella sp. NPDC050124 TaxID=3364114 RepID=UPI003792CAE0
MDLYNRDRSVLRATFGLYRAWDETVNQNMDRKQAPKQMLAALDSFLASYR